MSSWSGSWEAEPRVIFLWVKWFCLQEMEQLFLRRSRSDHQNLVVGKERRCHLFEKVQMVALLGMVLISGY
jgi:hypothetical protein